METKIRKQAKPDYGALQDELERRYGPAVAQDIVDQIRRTETAAYVPGYMPVKAASEVVELFRKETRDALRRLKSQKRRQVANDEAVINLELERMRQEFERLFGLYFQSQRGFYRLYCKAMSAYTEEAPATRKYKKTSHEQEMAQEMALAG